MKILFINFNLGSTAGINNGIAALSAILKKNGHNTGLLFLNEEMGYEFDLKRMKKDITAFKPDIIGISLVETQSKYMKRFMDDVRRYYKGFIICGGSYPTMSPEDVLAVNGVDAVCVGEGDDAFPELAAALSEREGCGNIQNIWCKSAEGKIIKNRLRPFKDLNDLPPEDKELFDLDKLLKLKNYQLEVMLGRGCVYQCSYCINKSYVDKYKKFCSGQVKIGDYVRIKDPDTVIGEISRTIKRHPKIKKIAFIDDNFLMYSSTVKKFFKIYQKEIGLPFMCNANPLSFDRAKGEILKDAGCDDIRFGVESGSERVKKEVMNRPVANKRVVESFKITAKLGMMSSSFNMIGLPTETKDEVFETLKLNALIMPDTVKLMTFYPFKSTPLYGLCSKLGLIDRAKKESLDNYDTFTCLKFSTGHQLFLKKIQVAFNWYMNVFLDNDMSAYYKKLIERIEAMDETEWMDFDFHAADKEASNMAKGMGATHYFKFVNRSLAAKFPRRHSHE